MIDSHAHLHFPQFDKDREDVLKRCEEKLDAVITVGCDVNDSFQALELAESSAKVWASAGVHPHEASLYSPSEIREGLSQLLKSERCVAVGEAGLDFYRNLSPKKAQLEAFKTQIELSRKFDKPIIIHTRDAQESMIKILEEEASLKGVLHCFTGGRDLLKSALKSGLFISFSCMITYPKNEELRKLAKEVPSSRLLIETDSPYLPPQKLRGKRNEPVNVAFAAMELSKVTGLSFSDINRITTINAKRLFNLPMSKEESEPKLVYKVRRNLYINLTTKCPCNCIFCFRGKEKFILGYNLALDREPPAQEYMYRIKNPSIYDELVFCGYGEPFERFDALRDISRWAKRMGAKKIRVNTNGLGFLITGRDDILEQLRTSVDSFNVSLNAGTEDDYLKIVRPKFGKRAFESVIKFIKSAQKLGFEVVLSAVEHPEVNISAFKELAQKLGLPYKIRKYKMF